jgi:hypothetical protein
MVGVVNVQEDILYDGRAEAEAFVKRCEDRGVPREWLVNYAEHYSIKATQAIGLGSMGVRLDITNQVLSARHLYDAEGQVAATRDWLAARVGYRNIDKYRPPVSRDQIPSGETSMATLENNDIANAQPVVAASEQLHGIHMQVHAPLVARIIEAFDAGQELGDPGKTAEVIAVALQHIQNHAQFMEMDEAFKDVMPAVKQLVSEGTRVYQALVGIAKKLQIQQQKAAAEGQQKVADAEKTLQERELEAKIFEIIRKYQVEAAKQESLNAMRAQKTQEQMGINRARAAADIQLKKEKQDAELEIKRGAASGVAQSE